MGICMTNKMYMYKKRCRAMIRLTVALLLVQMMSMTSQAHAQPAEGYSRTIEALQQRYADEIMAHRKYTAYSKQACAEGYRNIAHLFKTLAASEGVHARNFKKILSDLGVKTDTSLISGKIDVASTSHNLKHAANVERDEIDREYPEILASIRPENHQEAITLINYAWQAEKQHRDLIVKLQKAAVRWFGIIVNRVEGKDTTYYVCQVCGSTLNEIPEKNCPISGSPVSEYREIEHWPLKVCPRYVEEEEDPGD